MTDESAVEPTPDAPPAQVAEEPTPPTTAKPTKAEKLEAKAAKLRETEAARVAVAQEREAARASAAPSSGTRRWLIVTGVVAVAALILLGLTIGYAVHERGRANNAAALDQARSSATRSATVFATDFSSYDYATLKADFARTSADLTPAFAKKYAQISASLEATIDSTHGKVVGKVSGVGVVSVSKSSAVLIVLIDQTVTSSLSKTPRIDRNRVRMTLVRQKNGSWLASDLEPE